MPVEAVIPFHFGNALALDDDLFYLTRRQVPGVQQVVLGDGEGQFGGVGSRAER